MAIKKFNSVEGYTVGGNTVISVIDANGNVTANNLTVTNDSNLGNIANITITGGSNGQAIITDGSGNLSFSTISGSSNKAAPMPWVIPNGESFIVNANFQGLYGTPITINGELVVDGVLVDVSGSVQVAAGSNTEVNYNDEGNLAGSANFTYNNATNVLSVPTLQVTGNIIPTANVTYNLGNDTNRFNNLFLAGNTITLGNATLAANATALIMTNPGGGQMILSGASNITLGNIANINIDGNASNILYGNGVFAGAPVTYGNSNVASFLASFGSNTITTTGNIAAGNVNVTSAIVASTLTSNVSTGTAPLVVSSTTKVANLNADTVDGYDTSTTATANTIAVRNSDGNLTANYFIGNGSQLTGLSTSSISNGNSNVSISSANGDVTISSAGNANVLIITGTGANINGTANISGNANVGNIGGTGALFTTVGGTLTTAAQPNITSVGTLSSATVTGNVVAGNVYANTGTVGASLLTGTITTAAQPNVTSVGTLSSLTVSGNANVGNLGTAGLVVATGNVTGGNINTSGKVVASTLESNVATGTAPFTVASTTKVTNLNADLLDGFSTATAATANTVVIRDADGSFSANIITGTLSGAATTAGTVTTAAQPNITSVGTLSSLTVTGNANTGNIGAAAGVFTTVAGSLTTATQSNITSVGTLASLDVTGNITTSANLVTDLIVGKTTGISISSAGANQPVYLKPSGTGAVNVWSAVISNVATPVASTDAATKGYVDAAVEGLHIHAPCSAATPDTLANISSGTVTYDNGTSGVGATLTTTGTYTTIDSVNIATANTRVLVKSEANAAHNGIYIYSNSTVLTRATDFDTPTEMGGGDFTFVQQGTLYNDTGWVMTDPVTTVGTSNVNFVQFSGAGTYTAGTGLTLTGTQFSISNTAVSAGTYGNGDAVASFTVNAQGQITNAANTVITANAANLTGTTLNSSVVTSSLTSTGTLSSLTISGNLTVDTTTLVVNSTNNIVGIGAAPSVNNTPALLVASTFAAPSGISPYNGLYVRSTDAVTGNVGGVISLGGVYQTGQEDTRWAAIAGLKENATDGEYGGYLSFYSRAHGGLVAERMRIAPGGNVGIANTAPTHTLSVTGTFNASGNAAANNFNATTHVTAGNVYANSGTVNGLIVSATVGQVDPSGVGGFAAGQVNETTTGFNAPGLVIGSSAGQHGAIVYAGNIMYFGTESGSDNTMAVRAQLNSGGTFTASLFTGTLTTAAQPNITSVGTLTSLTVSGNLTGKLTAYTESVNTVGTITANTNLDTSAYNLFDVTLGAANVTLTFTNPPASGISRPVTVILRQDATGNRLATFANALYSDGIDPVLSTNANAIDILTFFTVTGGNSWFGTFAMANVS